jgi:hypothetical protein
MNVRETKLKGVGEKEMNVRETILERWAALDEVNYGLVAKRNEHHKKEAKKHEKAIEHIEGSGKGSFEQLKHHQQKFNHHTAQMNKLKYGG